MTLAPLTDAENDAYWEAARALDYADLYAGVRASAGRWTCARVTRTPGDWRPLTADPVLVLRCERCGNREVCDDAWTACAVLEDGCGVCGSDTDEGEGGR
jgi:hypothetical protein